jgi:hypothetical protein
MLEKPRPKARAFGKGLGEAPTDFRLRKNKGFGCKPTSNIFPPKKAFFA